MIQICTQINSCIVAVPLLQNLEGEDVQILCITENLNLGKALMGKSFF